MARIGTAALVTASALLAACGSVSAQPNCGTLDWSGTFDVKVLKLLYYNPSEGNVIAEQDPNAIPTFFITAHPDMSSAFIISRDGPVQIGNGTVSYLTTSISLCLQPSAAEPMRCVDSDDVGTWEVNPTAIDDSCNVHMFNVMYTEPGESDCEESPCQGEWWARCSYHCSDKHTGACLHIGPILDHCWHVSSHAFAVEHILTTCARNHTQTRARVCSRASCDTTCARVRACTDSNDHLQRVGTCRRRANAAAGSLAVKASQRCTGLRHEQSDDQYSSKSVP